ncbi:MAG: SpoIVB peptidase S55 domain-containing protein [Candidatus Eisenbacteria bacterium]
MRFGMRSGSASAFASAAFVSALIVVSLPSVLAADAARADGPDERFVPVEELRRGDRCVGRTVFVGTNIEEFELTILGVVRGAAPGTDLIIGRAEGTPLEGTGILEGMSGSPVYKDGRLVGAIASTWQFSKEPIAGITPIGEMLTALELMDSGDQASRSTGADGFPGLAMLPGGERATSSLARIIDEAGVLPLRAAARVDPSPVAFRDRKLVSIAAPLVVSGATEDYLRRVSDVLGSGVTPMRGAGVASGIAASGRSPDSVTSTTSAASLTESPTDVGRGAAVLEPGSAVGVQFVRGDVNWTAIGTVTHRDGDRLVAFGHPLFNAGSIDMPMVSAYVHAVMPLQSMSFKYATGGELLGTMREDRNRAVAGIIGPGPPMVPLTVNIRRDDGSERRFEFETVSDRPYAALFSGLAFGGAMSSAVKSSGPVTVELSARIDTGEELVDYRDVFSTSEPAMRCSGELSLLLSVLTENAFVERDLKSVELDVVVREGDLWTAIARVDADRSVYRPGDEVGIRVFLRPRRGEPFERELSLRLPDSLPTGTITLRVGDATSFHLSERDRLGFGAVPRSYEQLLELVRRSKPGNIVVAQLLSDSPGLSLSGMEMRGVPGRVGLAMVSSATSGAVDPSALSVLCEREFAVENQAVGFFEMTIHVEGE